MSAWSNQRWQRLGMWALRLPSPSLGRVPTFREAWTGSIVGRGPCNHCGWNGHSDPCEHCGRGIHDVLRSG